uniref:Saposin B-type domain-containing protein n=1 Tax=Panagrolaimus sp. ES5 TaxID=591445 RepID=A0AC34FE05_9BILA
MNQKVIVLALCGLFAFSTAMPFDVLADDIDDCRLCEHIVGAAERHHHNNLNGTTQAQLKRELDRECFQFTHTHGDGAAKKCADFVNAHIATIYNDIKAGKRPPAVCKDLGLCGGASGAPPSGPPPTGAAEEVEEEPEVLAPHDPCRTCAFIVGRAEHHFKPNETSDQLKGHLENECKQLAQVQGQQAADHCKTIIDANIQTIYSDIKAGKRPHQICKDIGECVASSGAPPSGAPKADILARPHDPCRTCEFIIGRAEHHIHNRNVTDEKRLLRELEHECIQLAHSEGDQASVACLNLIQKDIDLIFNDINAGKRPRQICEDMGECHRMSGGTGAPPATVAATTTPTSIFKKFLNIFH